MRIFAKIRQVYDRLCKRKEASADRMRQEREHLSEQAGEAYETERRLAVNATPSCWACRPGPESRIIRSIV